MHVDAMDKPAVKVQTENMAKFLVFARPNSEQTFEIRFPPFSAHQAQMQQAHWTRFSFSVERILLCLLHPKYGCENVNRSNDPVSKFIFAKISNNRGEDLGSTQTSSFLYFVAI